MTTDFQLPQHLEGVTREEILARAETYAKENNFLPGDRIEELVSRLGGSIEWLSTWDFSINDGSLEVRGPRDFTIRLAAFTGAQRDTFTIAHELGHYVLHSKEGRVRLRAARQGKSRAETEANIFAAGLLMPKDDFKAACARYENRPKAVAARYLVSAAAAKVRMETLGISPAE